MDADRCVCCGEIIPEGYQVCIKCNSLAHVDFDMVSEMPVDFTQYTIMVNDEIEVNI